MKNSCIYIIIFTFFNNFFSMEMSKKEQFHSLFKNEKKGYELFLSNKKYLFKIFKDKFEELINSAEFKSLKIEDINNLNKFDSIHGNTSCQITAVYLNRFINNKNKNTNEEIIISLEKLFTIYNSGKTFYLTNDNKKPIIGQTNFLNKINNYFNKKFSNNKKQEFIVKIKQLLCLCDVLETYGYLDEALSKENFNLQIYNTENYQDLDKYKFLIEENSINNQDDEKNILFWENKKNLTFGTGCSSTINIFLNNIQNNKNIIVNIIYFKEKSDQINLDQNLEFDEKKVNFLKKSEIIFNENEQENNFYEIELYCFLNKNLNEEHDIIKIINNDNFFKDKKNIIKSLEFFTYWHPEYPFKFDIEFNELNNDNKEKIYLIQSTIKNNINKFIYIQDNAFIEKKKQAFDKFNQYSYLNLNEYFEEDETFSLRILKNEQLNYKEKNLIYTFKHIKFVNNEEKFNFNQEQQQQINTNEEQNDN